MKPKIIYEILSMNPFVVGFPIVMLVLYVLMSTTATAEEFFTLLQVIPPIGVSVWISYLVYEYTQDDTRDLFFSINKNLFTIIYSRVLVLTVLYSILAVFALFLSFKVSLMDFPVRFQLELLALVLMQILFYASFSTLMSILLKSNIWSLVSQVAYLIIFKGVLRKPSHFSMFFSLLKNFDFLLLQKNCVRIFIASITCFTISTLLLKKKA